MDNLGRTSNPLEFLLKQVKRPYRFGAGGLLACDQRRDEDGGRAVGNLYGQIADETGGLRAEVAFANGDACGFFNVFENLVEENEAGACSF